MVGMIVDGHPLDAVLNNILGRVGRLEDVVAVRQAPDGEVIRLPKSPVQTRVDGPHMNGKPDPMTALQSRFNNVCQLNEKLTSQVENQRATIVALTGQLAAKKPARKKRPAKKAK